MMDKDIELRKIEFTSTEYAKVRFEILNTRTGEAKFAETAVPENYEKGKNKYWDKILEITTVEKLKEKRQIKEEKGKALIEARNKQIESEIENEKLKELFNMKAYYFNMPFVENASDDDKGLIRKSPNIFTLQYIVQKLMDKYVDENNMTLDDLIEEIEDRDFELNE